MRGSTSIVICDAEDGLCGTWDVDHYETGASTVGGVAVTTQQRSPGWTNTDLEDLCPEHKPTPSAPSVCPGCHHDHTRERWPLCICPCQQQGATDGRH